MGVDITSYIEVKEKGEWVLFREPLFKKGKNEQFDSLSTEKSPFINRNYSFFGWLADIKNYSAVTPLDEPRGLPKDLSPELMGEYEVHCAYLKTFTYFTLAELFSVDYDSIVEDRRALIDGNGGCTAEAGEGKMMTLRDFLGKDVMRRLKIMKKRFSGYNLDDVRVIFEFS